MIDLLQGAFEIVILGLFVVAPLVANIRLEFPPTKNRWLALADRFVIIATLAGFYLICRLVIVR